MGLLDSLFDPSSYNNGLLSRLLPNVQNDYSGPSMGFGQPVQAPGLPAPQVVGNAPGGAPQIPPDTVMRSDNPAFNSRAQVPIQQVTQPQGAYQPAFMNAGDNAMAGLANFSAGHGLIGKLMGLGQGLSSGVRLDPAGMALQNQRAQFAATRDALIQNGEDPQRATSMAMLAVLNPEAAKTVLPEMLTNKEKWGVIRKDPLEGEQYGWINEREHTINGQPLGQGGAVAGQSTGLQGLTDKLTEMRTQGATPEQMLAAIPTGYRDDVQAMGEGRGVPANLGRAATRGPLLTLTKVVYPNFDETRIPTRIQMRKDFAGEGKNGQAIGAFNTVQHHLDQVSDAAEEFYKAGGGSDYPSLNALKMALVNNTGWDPKLRDAAQKLTDKMNAAEHEVTNAYNAGHISDTDRKTWETIKTSHLPAGQLRQRLADFEDLLAGKRESLNHMYRTEFGEDAPAIDRKANEATAQKVHNRLDNGGNAAPQSGGAQGKPAQVMQNGHVYDLQPDGSYK